jgi:chemosensory pili system protein ChpA (sensor histidine kinase/response regulator)
MRGVLSVLGLDQAAQATCACATRSTAWPTPRSTSAAPARDVFERLANNLGALGFLIDMLSVQPQLAKRMFQFDEASGRLDAVMGRREGAVELPDFEASGFHADLDAEAPPAPALDATQPCTSISAAWTCPTSACPMSTSRSRPRRRGAGRAAPAPSVADDPEMREIFLEEADEVIANARAALAELRQQPGDHGQLTIVRRAFHTLKGSARMVGLDDFGEGAWACEQLYNARLGEAQPRPTRPCWRSRPRRWTTSRAGASRSPGPSPATACPTRCAAAPTPCACTGRPCRCTACGAAATEMADAAPEAVPAPLTVELPVERQSRGAPPRRPISCWSRWPRPRCRSPRSRWTLTRSPSRWRCRATCLRPTRRPSRSRRATPPREEQTLNFGLVLDLDEPEVVVPAELPAEVPPARGGHAGPAQAGGRQRGDRAGTRTRRCRRGGGFKLIGPLRISIALFNIFLNEADELSRKLSVGLAEWAAELSQPVPPGCEARPMRWPATRRRWATTTCPPWPARWSTRWAVPSAPRATRRRTRSFLRAADDIRRLLHQFAAGFLKPHDPELITRLHAYEPQEESLTVEALLDELPAEAAVEMPVAEVIEIEPEPVPAVEPPEPRARARARA